MELVYWEFAVSLADLKYSWGIFERVWWVGDYDSFFFPLHLRDDHGLELHV